MAGKREHFVPRHYLRQFRAGASEQIAVAVIDPFKFVGLGGIKHQCQADNFYEQNHVLNDLMGQSESDLAPVLSEVIRKQDFDSKERSALDLLAVLLNLRTRRAVEEAKVFPKYTAYEFIKDAIAKGRLPEPKGGWKEGMIDFKGIPGFLFQHTFIPCYMELQTLECKLLRAPSPLAFITSDHPVVLLNQFCAHLEAHRSFVGFSRSGFQLFLPLNPSICAFFYDAKVYKVGSRGRRLLDVQSNDIDLINSLQVQSADQCLYFHDANIAPYVQKLVAKYAHLRTPIEASLRRLPGKHPNEEIVHLRTKQAKMPAPWTFCRYKRHRSSEPGERRDEAWTETIRRLAEDIDRNPGEEDIFSRLRRIIGE